MNVHRQLGCLYNVQAAGLALHALEPDEEIDVLEHIPRCASCQAVLDETERVLAEVAATIEQVDPPATLREAILAEAAQTVQSRPPATEEPEGAARGVHRWHRRVGGRAVRMPAPPRTGPTRRSRLMATALVLVGIVAIGGLAGAVRAARRPA